MYIKIFFNPQKILFEPVNSATLHGTRLTLNKNVFLYNNNEYENNF